MRIVPMIVFCLLASTRARESTKDSGGKKTKRSNLFLAGPGLIQPAIAPAPALWPAAPSFVHHHQFHQVPLLPVAPPVTKVGVPVPVPVDRPVRVPVAVPVDRPVPVHVPVVKHVAVPVDRPYPVHVPVIKPVPVDRPYPVHVPVHVPVDRPVPVHVPVDRPYPVPVPQPYPVIINRGVVPGPIFPAANPAFPGPVLPNVGGSFTPIGQIPPPPAPVNPTLPVPSSPAALQSQTDFQRQLNSLQNNEAFYRENQAALQNHLSQHSSFQNLVLKEQQAAYQHQIATNFHQAAAEDYRHQETDAFNREREELDHHPLPSSYYREGPPPPQKLKLIHSRKHFHPARITIRTTNDW